MDNAPDVRAFIAEQVFEAEFEGESPTEVDYYGLRIGVNDFEGTGENIVYVYIFHPDEELLTHIARKINMSFSPEGVDINKELKEYNKRKKIDG
jgi:hypothetical protein